MTKLTKYHAFGRGKAAYSHPGNRSFRATLEYHLDSYANAQSKPDKTKIVSMIFRAIQDATPQGGFIRQNDKGEWCRVPSHVAREKVRQMQGRVIDVLTGENALVRITTHGFSQFHFPGSVMYYSRWGKGKYSR
jgi:hypothetical protein